MRPRSVNPNWTDLHDDIDPARYYDETTLDSRLRGNDGEMGSEIR